MTWDVDQLVWANLIVHINVHVIFFTIKLKHSSFVVRHAVLLLAFQHHKKSLTIGSDWELFHSISNSNSQRLSFQIS